MNGLETLRQARERACISQEELAALARVSVRTVRRVELDQVEPHVSTQRVLAAALKKHPRAIAWPRLGTEISADAA